MKNPATATMSLKGMTCKARYAFHVWWESFKCNMSGNENIYRFNIWYGQRDEVMVFDLMSDVVIIWQTSRCLECFQRVACGKYYGLGYKVERYCRYSCSRIITSGPRLQKGVFLLLSPNGSVLKRSTEWEKVAVKIQLKTQKWVEKFSPNGKSWRKLEVQLHIG